MVGESGPGVLARRLIGRLMAWREADPRVCASVSSGCKAITAGALKSKQMMNQPDARCHLLLAWPVRIFKYPRPLKFLTWLQRQKSRASLIGSRLLMAAQRQIAARSCLIEGRVSRGTLDGGGEVKSRFVIATQR